MRTPFMLAFISSFVIALSSASAMDLVWSRGTGQYRCEATPAITDFDGDGALELLTVNVGGQVMLWKVDGSNKGAGQDGTVAELPKGEWSSSPLVAESREGKRIILGNTAGLLVCLDTAFKPVWTHQLPGKTQWSRAVPAVLGAAGQQCLAIGDQSGAVTCLEMDGRVRWTRAFKDSPVRTYIAAAAIGNAQVLLVAAGESVHCLDTSGEVRWSFLLGGELLAKPEPMQIGNEWRAVCANAKGDIVALDTGGKELWRTATGGAIDASITYWHDAARPLIVCTGLWGDAIAIGKDSVPAWRHAIHSKNRARPLVADVDGDGTTEFVAAMYNQHVYAFDRDGRCVDDVRVTGSVNASPVAIPNARGGQDIVVVTTAMQAHRFTPAKPHAVYDQRPATQGRIRVEKFETIAGAPPDAVVIDNPAGQFVRVNVSVDGGQGQWRFSRLSAADTIALPVPPQVRDAIAKSKTAPRFSVEISGPNGAVLSRKTIRARDAKGPTRNVWATLPYAALDARTGYESRGLNAVRIGPLYRGEIDEGAFVVRNHEAKDAAVQFQLDAPARNDGTAFGGAIALFRLVAVPTMNGEKVLDALVPIVNNEMSAPAGESTKVWLQADARDVAPGVYRGRVRVTNDGRSLGALDVVIDVDSLQLPEAPLALCTWDYVPNKWFPKNTAQVLDDMARHGVNVFPRTCAPKATYADGRLTFDWSNLDEELARVRGRGTLLLQIDVPPIEFGANAPADPHAARIEYLRAVRDHLYANGWPYESWALYPVDEPGLDYGGNAQRLVEAGQLFREADPKLRIYTDPVTGLSQRDFDRIAPFVDVWCPNMRLVSGLLVHDARITAIRDSGKPVWSYECVAQVRSLSPLRYNRANAWRADYFGIDGIGFWTHSTTQLDPWTTDPKKNDEYALVYPGDVPVSSVRWEAARDGIEDVGAMRLLEQALTDARAKHPQSNAVRNAEDVLRRVRVGVMEMADGTAVESRDYLDKGDRQLPHTWWDAAAFNRYRVQIAQATRALRSLEP